MLKRQRCEIWHLTSNVELEMGVDVRVWRLRLDERWLLSGDLIRGVAVEGRKPVRRHLQGADREAWTLAATCQPARI